jgi:hypothetical protein
VASFVCENKGTRRLCERIKERVLILNCQLTVFFLLPAVVVSRVSSSVLIPHKCAMHRSL